MISWLGRDFARFAGTVGEDEEMWLSQEKPAESGRPCVIYGEALFVHFAFYTQRPLLETHSTYLDEYVALAGSAP